MKIANIESLLNYLNNARSSMTSVSMVKKELEDNVVDIDTLNNELLKFKNIFDSIGQSNPNPVVKEVEVIKTVEKKNEWKLISEKKPTKEDEYCILMENGERLTAAWCFDLSKLYKTRPHPGFYWKRMLEDKYTGHSRPYFIEISHVYAWTEFPECDIKIDKQKFNKKDFDIKEEKEEVKEIKEVKEVKEKKPKAVVKKPVSEEKRKELSKYQLVRMHERERNLSTKSRYQKWSKEEDKVLMDENNSIEDCARKLNRSIHAVYTRRWRLKNEIV